MTGTKVTVLVRGGLGNQMFQAAFKWLLEARFNVAAELVDLTSRAKVPRSWALDVFGIRPHELSTVARYRYLTEMRLFRVLDRLHLKSRYVLQDRDVNASGSLECAPRIASGYWQRAAFVEEVADRVRRAYRFPKVEVPFDLRRPNAAIHVRRGDYVSDPVAMKTHLVCDERWYQKAWDRMRSIVPNCTPVVFSDDPTWAKDRLSFAGAPIFIETPALAPAWHDMALMAKCDHFIISNSSYSWWSSFLGETASSNTIAPKFWFNGVSTSDLGIARRNWCLQ